MEVLYFGGVLAVAETPEREADDKSVLARLLYTVFGWPG